MSELSFGTGAQAHGRVGNVFLAFIEVKRAMFVASDGPSRGRGINDRLIVPPSDHERGIPSTTGIVSLRFPSLLFPFADLACPT